MALRNVFGALGLDATLVAIRDKLPTLSGGAAPVTGPVTDTQLRATAVPVSGPLTDAQLRAAAIAITGALTDTQLRAAAVPVSGPLTDTQLRAAAVPVSGPLTDTQLRATALQVSGPATNTELRASALPVSGPLTDAQLRAAAIATIEQSVVITGQATQTATINNIIPLVAGAAGTDVSNLRSASVQVVSTGTAGTFIFEQSNDNVNWIPLPVFNAALTTGVPIVAAITATASAIIYSFALRCNFVRLRIATAITGGSIQAFSRFSSEPWTPSAMTVSNPTAANLQVTTSGASNATLQAGTNLAGDVGQQYRANATGAGTIANLNCPATPALQTIKGTAGRLIGIYLVNTNAAMRWLKLFNATAPVLASATAALRVPLPQNQPVFISIEGGMAFATAITCAICSTGSLTDATGVVTLDDVTGFAVFA